ncbi:hypothetical protein HYC85_007954 [Camellia sinensis]|uniref:Uncharacterized protein n=1 Tax=Camellia sinensis TaxID=4442 RepID=A0A7J7HSU0_CAMSI|nr:hypothetical protein HYC85_007954 [Camellia sinensis]
MVETLTLTVTITVTTAVAPSVKTTKIIQNLLKSMSIRQKKLCLDRKHCILDVEEDHGGVGSCC